MFHSFMVFSFLKTVFKINVSKCSLENNVFDSISFLLCMNGLGTTVEFSAINANVNLTQFTV